MKLLDQLRPLFPYLRPYRTRLILGILCVAFTAAGGLLAPIIIGSAFDAMTESMSQRTLLLYAAALIGVTIFQGLFLYAQRMVLVTMSRNIERDMLDDLMAHFTRLDAAYYQRQGTGDLMARATNDLQAVRVICGPSIMYAANTIFTGTAALVLMSQIHLGLTLGSLCTLPLIAVVTKVVGRKNHVFFGQVQDSFGAMSTRVQENLAGVRVVRAFAREQSEAEQFDKSSHDYVRRNIRLIAWDASLHPALMLLIGFGFAVVLLYGGVLMVSGTITVGAFVAFNLFLGKLSWPMIAVGFVVNQVQRGTASLRRIQEVLTTEPAIHDEPPLAEVEEIRGAIRLDRLSFAYPPDPDRLDDRRSGPVLLDLDVDIPAGTTVAMLGRTGSGKSTLLSLIPRLADPPPGSLFVDGHDVRSLSLATLRGAVAVVPQETFLFSTTLRENIALGAPDADEAEILHAAELAGLGRDLLDSFPRGLDTIVGERGITLSGGQKQRVALARGILRDPRILLLDDSLSAVDAQTEETILHNLRTVFPGRTVLFASHRISAVQTADLILVLDRGRIVERGDHVSLLAHDGLYADLYRRQRLEEALEAV
ncbi:MAG: ABC transporter ATP-binding protein [Acidobacteriota bacterium]